VPNEVRIEHTSGPFCVFVCAVYQIIVHVCRLVSSFMCVLVAMEGYRRIFRLDLAATGARLGNAGLGAESNGPPAGGHNVSHIKYVKESGAGNPC
jgi:hypothetical protein